MTDTGCELYAIEVQRSCYVTLYTFAATKEQAKQEADELVANLPLDDWADVEDDIHVAPAERPPRRGAMVWSGGPDGDYVSWPPDEAASSSEAEAS